ncbi:hypothetical protein LDENG_00118030, partial [Lucifuga dentata]
PGQTLQLLLGDSEVFPGQLGDIIPPACPGSSQLDVPRRYQDASCHLPRETTRRHPY